MGKRKTSLGTTKMVSKSRKSKKRLVAKKVMLKAKSGKKGRPKIK